MPQRLLPDPGARRARGRGEQRVAGGAAQERRLRFAAGSLGERHQREDPRLGPLGGVDLLHLHQFRAEAEQDDGAGPEGHQDALHRALQLFPEEDGGDPLTISPPDVYPALERGVVDGLAWPEGSVAAYGWEKHLKYKIGPNFYHSTTMTVINLKKFNGLSKAHRDLLMEYGEKFEKDSNAVLAKASEVDNAKLEKAGIKTIMLKGDIAKAYLNTIYGAKWAENDTREYKVDYKTLKSKVYRPGS
ncbi:MAG: hypothetical protein GEU92_04295 [Alphaproteobacteria bacterium]|nr:hypothetical protein [Alphaproteobacteria bacterium]